MESEEYLETIKSLSSSCREGTTCTAWLLSAGPPETRDMILNGGTVLIPIPTPGPWCVKTSVCSGQWCVEVQGTALLEQKTYIALFIRVPDEGACCTYRKFGHVVILPENQGQAKCWVWSLGLLASIRWGQVPCLTTNQTLMAAAVASGCCSSST